MLRRRRDALAWARWERMPWLWDTGLVEHQPTMVLVTRVRQFASTGLKTYVVFPPEGWELAIWVPQRHVPAGTYLVVDGFVRNDVW